MRFLLHFYMQCLSRLNFATRWKYKFDRCTIDTWSCHWPTLQKINLMKHMLIFFFLIVDMDELPGFLEIPARIQCILLRWFPQSFSVVKKSTGAVDFCFFIFFSSALIKNLNYALDNLLLAFKAVSSWVSLTDQSRQIQITQWTNQNSKPIHAPGVKRGKTRTNKSQFLLVFLLIGGESGASLCNQSQGVAKQNQSKRE